MDDAHSARIADMHRRMAFAPDSVHQHRKHRWPYIPVHRFVDEDPSSTLGVDCWCLLSGDAALLECTSLESSHLEVGSYARIDCDFPYWNKLRVVSTESFTRETVEKFMEQFVEAGFPDQVLPRLSPGESYVKLL